MEHVAIDLGGKESQICVRGADGTILQETRCRTRDLGTYLEKRPPSRVIVETCSEAFLIADQARACGHEIRVVPATIVRALGVGARRTKTDRRDAQILSEVSTRIDLEGVHVPALASREHKSICGARDALVSARTKLINCTRGWMRACALRPKPGASVSFPERVRAMVEQVPPHIDGLLETIEQLTLRIREAEAEITRLAKASDVCRLMMSVPGIGAITSLQFVAAIDDVSRFDSAAKVHAYFGLTPGEDSSSERKRRTGITKAGSVAVRWLLVQAALSAKRYRRDDPMVQWALAVEARRGRNIATIALARKMAGILFALWRDGTAYDPKLGARSGTSNEEVKATV
jgi:transposase